MNSHEQTDKKLSQLTRQSKSIFIKFYKDVRDEFIKEYSKIDLTSDDVQSRINNANKYDRFKKLTSLLVAQIQATNQQAIKNVNSQIKEIYKLNYNAVAEKENIKKENSKEAKEKVEDNKNPYDEIAINKRVEKSQIKPQIEKLLTDAIVKGASVNMALSLIKENFEKNLKVINIITESEVTRNENLGTFEALHNIKLKDDEIIIKRWNTRKDTRVREAHQRAEGQEAELDRPFYVDGEELMYPRAINGKPGNVEGCRCFMTYTIVKK